MWLRALGTSQAGFRRSLRVSTSVNFSVLVQHMGTGKPTRGPLDLIPDHRENSCLHDPRSPYPGWAKNQNSKERAIRRERGLFQKLLECGKEHAQGTQCLLPPQPGHPVGGPRLIAIRAPPLPTGLCATPHLTLTGHSTFPLRASTPGFTNTAPKSWGATTWGSPRTGTVVEGTVSIITFI